jgi:hypothetical protein
VAVVIALAFIGNAVLLVVGFRWQGRPAAVGIRLL